MQQFYKILLLFVSGTFLIVGSALAQSNKNAKDKHAQGDPGGGKFKQSRFAGNGPPPWAPAHGYRRKHYSEYGLTAYPIDIEVGRCNREVIGQVLGGAVGGLAGSQIGDGTGRLIAVATGTLLGVVIDGEIGKSMERADALCIDQALEHAPDGSSIGWNDADRQYTVTPKQTVQDDQGRYCREYTMDANVQGRPQQVFGKACRQPDGSWQLGT